jgi:hypothetical protein
VVQVVNSVLCRGVVQVVYSGLLVEDSQWSGSYGFRVGWSEELLTVCCQRLTRGVVWVDQRSGSGWLQWVSVEVEHRRGLGCLQWVVSRG